MRLIEYTFSGKKVKYFLDASFSELSGIITEESVIVITDEVVLRHYPDLAAYRAIVIPSGEQYKNQSTVDYIIQQLIETGADRKTFIIGVGGGVVTDIAGFSASVYMRGLPFCFVPTTVLAQVDASIGGKNGIDSGLYKNVVGLIRQPEFILFDHSLLGTLPIDQWVNGFAEIIKHACIKDALLFDFLENHELQDFQDDKNLLAGLIQRNVIIKSEVVKQDEFETGDRKLLNFGHTIGHAIENVYSLPHGHAVSIGMAAACYLSEELNQFQTAETQRILGLLKKYRLPVSFPIDTNKMFEMFKMDKKRVNAEMNFILLNRIGEAVIKSISLTSLEDLITKRNITEAQV